MKVEFVNIYERGNLQNERIHFRAKYGIDIRFYVVLDSNYLTPDTISAGGRTCYWFKPKTILAGEHIVLYTRAGVDNEEKRSDGSVYHFFFRSLTNPLYKNSSASASIFEINDWVTSPR